MQAGIVIDTWKLPIFERHLSSSGYDWKQTAGLAADTLLLTVNTPNAHALEGVVRSANTEADLTGAPQ